MSDEKFELSPWDRRWVQTLYIARILASLGLVLCSVVSAVGLGCLFLIATEKVWIGAMGGIWAYAVGMAANKVLKDKFRYYIIAEVARLAK